MWGEGHRGGQVIQRGRPGNHEPCIRYMGLMVVLRVIQGLGPIAAYHITYIYTIPLSKLDFLDGLEFGEEPQKAIVMIVETRAGMICAVACVGHGRWL